MACCSGWCRGSPSVELDPDLVLLVFLPPLLYAAAFFADLRSLRDGARPIALNAIGLVLVTAAAVAVVAHEVIGLPWAISFALGAIVSPTDPVAATAILQRVGAPRRIVNILEGESLVNDATALVAYKVAVAAAVGASVSASSTVLEFFGAVAGGVAIGLAVGYVVAEIRRRISDPITSVTISLFTAYGAFIPADEIGASGVLAVVSCGIYLGWRAPEIVNPEARMQGFALWSVLTFLLNATLFILIGLQLPLIVDGLQGQPTGQVVGHAALVCVVVIGVRFLWAFTVPYLIRAIDRRPQQRARRSTAASRVITSWAGMRGAVSLAAALALPLTTDAGAPLPGARPDPVHHLRADPRDGRGGGADASVPGPPVGGARRRHRGGERGGQGPPRRRARRARAHRRARARGVDPRRDDRAGPQPLHLPPAPVQDPGGQDRGRGRDRGGLDAPTSG